MFLSAHTAKRKLRTIKLGGLGRGITVPNGKIALILRRWSPHASAESNKINKPNDVSEMGTRARLDEEWCARVVIHAAAAEGVWRGREGKARRVCVRVRVWMREECESAPRELLAKLR